MMRLVQQGAEDAPLVLVWLCGESMDGVLRDVLPTASICASSTATVGQAEQDITRARTLAGSRGPFVFAGYSAGCQLVRELALRQYEALAWLLLDGAHASWPPAPWQIDVWTRLAVRARTGHPVLAVTATQQRYVERLDKPFASTRTVLDRVLGRELSPWGEVHDGELHAYSVPSNDIDAEAHRLQLTEWLPRLLRAHVAPLMPRARALPDGTLGERLVWWMRAEQAAGVREQPPGSNTSPRIRQYLSACRRRSTEQPLGITAGAWCAAMVSFGLQQVARGGEAYPAPRAAGVELRDDAQENGTWFAPSKRPRVGDVCILKREGEAWNTHTCVVCELDAEGPAFSTIGGNEGDAVRVTARRLDDPALLGFIRIGR